MKCPDSSFDEDTVTDTTTGVSKRREFLTGVLALLSATAGCAQQGSQNGPQSDSNSTTQESSSTSSPSETVSRSVSDSAAWPAPGYNPQNQNRNPTVSVSTSPELVRSVSVSGDLSGYQVAAVERQLFFSVRQTSNDEVIRVGAENQTLSVGGSEDAFADVVAGPDGLIHVGNLGVTTIDSTSGEILWSHGDGGNTRMTPTSETLYTTGNQSVFAFDARTGALQWSVRDLTQFESPPAVDHERVYVAGALDNIYAFDRFTGEQQWTRPYTNGGTFVAPTLTDELVIVLEIYGTVSAYEKSNGDLRWRTNLGDEDLFGSSASLYDSTVIVSTRSGTNSTRAFDIESGETVWRSDDTVRWSGLLCEQVYVGVGQRGEEESSIVGISAKEGDKRWELTVSGDVITLFAAYDAIGAITYEGQVHILSTSTSPLG